MKFQKLNLFLGLFLIILVVTSVFGQTNSNENQTNQSKGGIRVDYTAQDIIDEVPESEVPAERTRINAKKRRYDRPNNTDPRFNRDLTKLAPGIGIGSVSEEPSPSSLPVEQSTLILVGKVTRAQPYLTESNTAIFTEITFEIEDVLKAPDASITRGASIKIDGGSGALRLANGKVIRYEANAFGKLPRSGRRYLLFLKPIHDGQDITIETGYELQNGKVFPLLETYVYTPQTRKITKRSPYINTDEIEFRQIVRNAITTFKASPNKH